MALRTSNGNGRTKPQQALEKISLKQILDTLRAWQNESETVDSEALLKALCAFRKGDFTARLSENQTGIAGEIMGEMRRGITVLKMRGSQHDKSIREFNIDSEGIMHIGRQFANVGGILSGQSTQLNSSETENLSSMFDNRAGE